MLKYGYDAFGFITGMDFELWKWGDMLSFVIPTSLKLTNLYYNS